MELMRAKFRTHRDEGGGCVVDPRPLGAHASAPCRLHVSFLRALGLFQAGSASLNDRSRDFFLDRESFDKWARRYEGPAARREESRRGPPGTHEPRQPQVCPPQLSGADRHREGSSRKTSPRSIGCSPLLQNPYSDQPGMDVYAAPPPNWGKHLAVSCSS